MNEDIKERWVAALESGSYKQVDGMLSDGDGFCCLGVLCEIAVQDQVVIRDRGDESIFYVSKIDVRDADFLILPEAVSDWGGVSNNPVLTLDINDIPEDKRMYLSTEDSARGEINLSLSDLNDTIHMTFPEIAAVVKKYL